MNPPRLFLSYRREDARGQAVLLANVLRERGAGEVFLDVTIRLGEDFVERIHTAIADCDVVLVLIGRQWQGPPNDSGVTRLHDASDWVHVEVRTALERGVRVVPVLVDGASVPPPADLPEPLRKLASRQAATFSTDHWRRDAHWIADELLGSQRAAPPTPEPVAVPAKAQQLPKGNLPQDVVVVAARSAYAEYLEASAYVCQPGRGFRPTATRLGFYFDRLIRREVPQILHVRDQVPWSAEHAAELRQRDEEHDSAVADLIERSFAPGSTWFGKRPNQTYDRFKVLLLSAPEDARTLVLPDAILHSGASAFTMGQRYVGSEVLAAGPATTAGL